MYPLTVHVCQACKVATLSSLPLGTGPASNKTVVHSNKPTWHMDEEAVGVSTVRHFYTTILCESHPSEIFVDFDF